MSDQPSTTGSASFPVTLKWNKKTFPLAINLGETATDFKQRVQAQTGVPLERQKLTAKKAWKGILKDTEVLDADTIKNPQTPLLVTLIGSAETLSEPTQKTTFLEDLTPEDLQKAQDMQAQAAMADAQGMIQALQLPPHLRDDHKQELYQYNRLVTGLPQRQIEQELKCNGNTTLQGKVAMNLGLELRRAYVNDLAVLPNGSLISALDDGHVQLWKHASQEHDVVHNQVSNEDREVNSVVALQRRAGSPVAFATAGRGCLQLWTEDADPIATLPSAMPGTSPASLVCVFGSASNSSSNSGSSHQVTCLATRFQITRQSNALQFRLPPQNETERQRRALTEAQERAIQESLGKSARSVQVWYSMGETAAKPTLQTQILEPPVGPERSAPITCLAVLRQDDNHSTKVLVAGDSSGGLRLWGVQEASGSLQFQHLGLFQLTSPCSVVCMEPLQNGRLAVSTDVSDNSSELEDAFPLHTQTSRAVHILDISKVHENQHPCIQSTLTGHTKDAVICMCQLPNGDLVTGGGKLDATLQLWSGSQLLDPNVSESGEAASLSVQAQATKTLTDVGYVFALEVLPDAKDDSNYFALAAGRYNTVKIIIYSRDPRERQLAVHGDVYVV
ncbi:ubiquitin thiolesterase activity [Seminavis robusta]|uniref:Ubiquitin thiolesterase activity n=1 Tax=Seminavis robusta TaxID=568900 RepID=A0A9N8DUE8_9STRA|nr:ubiquitin thiolesterase activity [Seminavis robusta]|eukprot:Sro351_g123850.1 ubiquitin thiolesterase activity (618) ;mRNA; r:14443-16388